MQLEQAIKSLINRVGADAIHSPQAINMLSDYGAFEDYPFVKTIFETCQTKGIVAKIIKQAPRLHSADPFWNSISDTIYNKLGFRKDGADYFVSEVAKAFGVNPKITNTKPQRKPQKGRHIQFLGLDVDGTTDEFADILEQKGFVRKGINDGCTEMVGKYVGIDNCTLTLISAPLTQQMISIKVEFPGTDWETLEPQYDVLKDACINKYGMQPTLCNEKNEASYLDFLDNPTRAFSTGEAKHYCEFETKTGSIYLSLSSHYDYSLKDSEYLNERLVLSIQFTDTLNNKLETKAKSGISDLTL